MNTVTIENKALPFVCANLKLLKPVHVPGRKWRRKRKLWFVVELMHGDPSMYHTETWFVRHRLYPERTKIFFFVFVFVFVLAHEQPISTYRSPPHKYPRFTT